MEEILIVAIIFGSLVTIIYLALRKKERMTMLEKGVDASVFFTTKKNNSQGLKYGLMLIGVALGILIGNILAVTPAFMYEKEAAYFSMIFLFGGLALVIYYFMAKKMVDDDGDNDSLMKK